MLSNFVALLIRAFFNGSHVQDFAGQVSLVIAYIARIQHQLSSEIEQAIAEGRNPVIGSSRLEVSYWDILVRPNSAKPRRMDVTVKVKDAKRHGAALEMVRAILCGDKISYLGFVATRTTDSITFTVDGASAKAVELLEAYQHAAPAARV